MGIRPGRGLPYQPPPPEMPGEATAAPAGILDPHPPALRLVPEHGVGRLSRWFVFFCRAEGHVVVRGVRECWDITPPSRT